MDRQPESRTNVKPEGELCKAILQQKDAEVSALYRNAEAVESKILQEGEEQARQIREKILAEAQSRIRQYDEEAAAELSQKNRFAWLEEREKLLEEVFVTLVSRFPEAVKSSEYAESLPAWIEEALTQVQAEQASISLDAYSAQLISDEQLTEIGKRIDVDLRRGEILSQGHGIVVSSLDGRRSFANTFEARLERQKPHLRILAARFLLGE